MSHAPWIPCPKAHYLGEVKFVLGCPTIIYLNNDVTYVGSIRHEDGAGQVARRTRADVDDGDAEAAGELLEVAHQEVLDEDGHHQVEFAGVQKQRAPNPIELIGRFGEIERQHSAHVVEARHLRNLS